MLKIIFAVAAVIATIVGGYYFMLVFVLLAKRNRIDTNKVEHLNKKYQQMVGEGATAIIAQGALCMALFCWFIALSMGIVWYLI